MNHPTGTPQAPSRGDPGMSRAFPPGFLWGCATAAHQVEGGNFQNDWWRFEEQGGVVTGDSFGRRERPLAPLQ